jgi:N-acetylneuraminate lyase
MMCAAKGNLYAVIKQVLLQRKGLDLGGVRAPLANLFHEDAAIVDRVVEMIDTAVRTHIS